MNLNVSSRELRIMQVFIEIKIVSFYALAFLCETKGRIVYLIVDCFSFRFSLAVFIAVPDAAVVAE